MTVKPKLKQTSKVIGVLFGIYCSTSSFAMDISGVIRLNGSEANTANIAEAIIYFVPDDRSLIENDDKKENDYRLTMSRKQFVPRTMAVPVGSNVRVPNDDRISHNAFSPSNPSDFDLDLYGQGQEKEFTVNGPGVIKVYCNVHYHMVAYVLGLDTPYFTQPDANGQFSMTVPDAPGKLMVWHERTGDYVQTINPDQNNIIDIGLRITKRRLPTHTNKFGKSYRRER